MSIIPGWTPGGFFGGGGAVLTLSGATVSAFRIFPSDAHAEIKVDDDGNLYRRINFGSFVQINTATDWIRPTSAAPGDYEVRFTNLTGQLLDFSTVSEDTWHPLSVGDFILRQSEVDLGTESSTFDIEIRKGSSGGALVSASHTLTAIVDI